MRQFIIPMPAKRPAFKSDKRPSKYRAVKTTVDGIEFDSKAEARRYGQLKNLEQAGAIRELKLQPKFVLLEKIPGQRAVTYKADFQYIEKGRSVVEDVKGFKTQQFLLRAKMFRAKFRNVELRITK
jgi:hypothetical protein